MSQIECPNCDGQITIPELSSTVVCEYCNTTISVKSGEILKENYFLRLQYNLNQAAEKMYSWGMKQLGAPKGIEQSKIVESKLVFWPFWVVEVEAKAKFTGVQRKPDFSKSEFQMDLRAIEIIETGKIDMEEDIFIPANSDTPQFLKEYFVATKRKEFFDTDQILEVRGTTKPVHMEQKVVLQKAKNMMSEILREEALKEVDSITKMDENLKISAVFLVSIPIWHIKYHYKIRNYDALVDGASGRIVYLEFPRKMAFRAMTLLSGILHLVIGGGIGVLLAYLGLTASDLIFPTIFGIVFGSGMIVISLWFFRTAISLKAGMEEAR